MTGTLVLINSRLQKQTNLNLLTGRKYMNTLNTEINMITANSFVVNKESRKYLMSLLSIEEQKIFKDFIKQLGAK